MIPHGKPTGLFDLFRRSPPGKDETTGGAFPLRVAVKGVTVDISALSLSPWDMTLGSKLPFFSYGRDGHHTL